MLRHKVLVIAEAANPKLTSVALIGFSLANALREVADITLATELRNRDAVLEAGFPKEQLLAIDNRKWQGAAFRVAKALRGGESLGWTIYSAFYNVAYPVFEKKLWKAVHSQIQGNEFDAVHRITPLSPTTVSPIAGKIKACGVPFIIGPMNGGVPWPKGFDAVRRKEREWLSYVRGAYKMMPGLKGTREHASAMLLASGHTFQEVATTSALRDKSIYIPENAIDPERFPVIETEKTADAAGRLRLAFVGRLVPYKGAVTLLEAVLPLLKSGRATLDIIGDGSEMPRLKEMVADNDLTDSVSLPGWVPHESLHKRLRNANVFAFPSVREFGGGVVLEAMALGLAPVVADYAGPAELVPDDCGWKVPFESVDSLRHGFARKLTELADNPQLIKNAGKRSEAFVREHFTWAAKARQIEEVYAWVADNKPKPRFPFAFSPSG